MTGEANGTAVSVSGSEWSLSLATVEGLETCAATDGEIAVFSSRTNFDTAPPVYLISDPQSLIEREQSDPDMRRQAGRPDDMLVHRDGGYLSDSSFAIQCRDLALMGLESRFTRCRIALKDEGLTAGFDVPARYSGCEGLIARAVINRLRTSHVERTDA